MNDRELFPEELVAIRKLLKELDKATRCDDVLGRFAAAQLNAVPIPVVMWGMGHPLH